MPSHQLHAEIEQLKERNRLLHIKSREERQKLEEELTALRYRDESQSRRLAEKQARLDELEIQAEEARADRQQLQADLDRTLADMAELQQKAPPATEQPTPTIELPEPADLLNQLKAKRKKSTATLADVEAILEMIEKSCDDTSGKN